MPLTYAEQVQFQTNTLLFQVIFAVSCVLIIGVAFLIYRDHTGFMAKYGLWIFFLIGTLIYLAAGLYLIFRIPVKLRADADVMYNIALQFRNGDYSALVISKAKGTASYSGGYLAKNPHQIGLAILLTLLVKIVPDVHFIFLVNLALILLNNLLILLITDTLFHHEKRTVFIAVLLTFLMLPHLFLCIFCYGIIPGLTALLLSFLALSRFERNGNVCHAVAGIAFAVLAVSIRNNYMIGVIAEIILTFLIFIRSYSESSNYKGHIRYLVTALVLVPALFIPNIALKAGIQQYSGVKIDSEVPKSAWIAMGLSESPTKTEGWYNGYVYNTFINTGYNTKATDEKSRALIAERLTLMKNDPDYAYTFFMRKLTSTWTEPTFESVWIGPLEDDAQAIQSPIIRDIYTGGNSYKIMNLICGIAIRLLAAGCILFLLRALVRFIKELTRNNSSHLQYTYTIFPLLFLLGGFLFHLFWETKSLYVFCFVYMLLPVAAAGLSFGDGQSNKRNYT